MSSYGSGFRNSVPAQQGTTLYGTSYGATDSQSTASSYYNETWGLFCSMHHMGCCRMGTTVGNGTVDAHGESWEVEQLYVCNDSVLPTAVGINPMITVQSVAYCIANGIADSLSGKTT
uniref:Glucose-methanol-choline oxidoreductase C-terminal domain-containing protein n=1 Tax=Oryza barthii TaxID=65489 RepID=A0A0D3GZC8_9ORYZ